jgi:apolipoprotein N-acyltransferase
LPSLPRPSSAGALALGGGFCVALSMPPWGLWPLAIVGIMLFEVSLGEFPERGQRAARGWLFGAGWLFMGMGWMWYLTAPGYLIAATLFGGFHALAALASPTGPWRVIGRPAAHTLAEALRLCFPFGGVPLATLPIGQAAGPLAGVVRVGGVVLLTWLVFQIGFALAGPSPFVPELARRRRRGAQAQYQGLLGFVAVIVVIVIAAVAPDGTGGAVPVRELRVAVVQGGGPQGTRAINDEPGVVLERHLAATSAIEAGSVDMVLWPENVIDVADFSASAELDRVAEQAQRIGAPFVVGITEDVPNDRFTNAQVVVTPEGQVTGRYDKVRRVPFGEYMPWRGLLSALGAPTDLVPRDAVAGDSPAYVDLPNGERLGVVISWEVFFGGRGNDGVSHGAQLIVNPTNGSSYTGTILQSQQVASSRLRAIEQGRWVVQASPTGFSAFITPDGDVLERTGVSEQRVISKTVVLSSNRTWYSRVGNIPWVVLALMALLATQLAVRRAARATPATSTAA